MKTNVQFDDSANRKPATNRFGVAMIYLLGLAIVVLQLRSLL